MTAYDVLARHLQDIQVMLNEHGNLLSSVKGGVYAPVLKECFSACPYKQRLKETLLETIQVLEESRKAFKSKQLEALRKKLIEVLAEIA